MLTGSKRKAMKMPGPRKTKPRKTKCRHRIVVRTWGELAGQVLSKRCSLSSGCGAPLPLGPSNDDIPLDEIAHATFAKNEGYWMLFEDPEGHDWDVTRPLREQWPWGGFPSAKTLEAVAAFKAHTACGDAQLDEVIEKEHATEIDAIRSTASGNNHDPGWQERVEAKVELMRRSRGDEFAPVDTASREPWHTTQETQLSDADRAETKLKELRDFFAESVTDVPEGAA